MAYTNNDILNLINFTIKKDTKGQPMTLKTFSLLLSTKSLELQEMFYDAYERTKEMTDSIRRFKVTKTGAQITPSGTKLTLPTDYAHEGFLYYKEGGTDVRPCEFVDDDQFMMRQSAVIEEPTSSYPIYRLTTDYIEYLPTTLNQSYFTFSYLRYVTEPFYDYYIDVNGLPHYLEAGATHVWTTGEIDSNGTTHTTGDTNWASLTVELDFNEEDKLKVATKILQAVSVPINEAGVYQYAEQLKTES